MLIKIKYKFIILMLIVLVGCKARTYNFVNDSKLVNQIEYKTNIIEKDSTLEISIELINKSDSTVLIPITECIYYSNITPSFSPFCYYAHGAQNIVSCTVKGYRKDYQFEGFEPGGSYSEINSFPYFLELEKNSINRVFLILPKYSKGIYQKKTHLELTESMFAKDSTYDICINLSLISKHNLIQLFGQNNEYNRLLKKNSNVNFTTPISYFSNAIIDSSNIPIDKNIRKKLDSLSRNRLVIDIFHKF